MSNISTKITPAVAVLLSLLGGCSPADFLNEQFVSSIVGGTAVNLPGNAPALLVGVENRVDRLVSVTVNYRDSNDALQTYTAVVEPGQRTAKALICPVPEITIGDLSNPSIVGALVFLGNGTPADPFIEVEPFGIPLQAGQNYDCGDGITFVVQYSTATKSGYQTFAYIQRAGDGG
jgi:hypothetical protein